MLTFKLRGGNDPVWFVQDGHNYLGKIETEAGEMRFVSRTWGLTLEQLQEISVYMAGLRAIDE